MTLPKEPSTDPLGRFVELDHERRYCEGRIATIKTEQAALAEVILDDWADRQSGPQQSAKVDGLTVYVAQDFVCGKRAGVDSQHLCEVLKRHGLGRMVSWSHSAASMKAWVKESLAEGAGIPIELAGLIHFDTITRLRTRKAS